MNDRIGKRTEQGAEFPLYTIHGNTYDKLLATTVTLDKHHFAVVGMGEQIDPEKIKALQATLTPPAPVLPKREVKSGSNENPSNE